MADWSAALMSAGLGFTGAVLLREWLIIRVSIWSLTTDDKGREHALRLLRLLKPTLRRELTPKGGNPGDPPELRS